MAFERLEDRTLMTVLTVNSLADNLTPGNGLVTLREAIIAAANDTATDLGQVGSGADQIVFSAGLNGNINLNAALGAYGGSLGGFFTQNLTITGNGAANTQIVGPGANSRVFTWGSLITPADLTLQNLTLRNGNGAAGNDGGAVYFAGLPGSDLTITNSTISGNSTNGAGGQGGGVAFFSTGALNITNSTFSNNSTNGNYGYGGAVYVYGPSATVTVTNSTFNGNFTTGTNSHSGAIHLATAGAADNLTVNVTNSTFTNNSTQNGSSYAGAIGQNGGSGLTALITITNSTISGNTAGANGGGVSVNSVAVALVNSTVSGNNANYGGGVYSAGATVLLLNSTLSGNIAATSGGGISIDAAPAGTVVLYNSTLTLNQAGTGGGGGISMNTNPGTTNLGVINSIVAGNTVASGFGPEFTTPGGPLTVVNSLIGRSDNTSLASTGGVVGLNGNIVGGTTVGTAVNALLAPLTNNGGPTLTHALFAASPAINTGNNALIPGLTNDQRGAPFYRIFGGTVDMGAFESQALASIIGNVATFNGRNVNDNFRVTLATGTVSVNQLPYVLPVNVTNVQINGLGGTDGMVLVGTAGTEVVTVNGTTANLVSSSLGVTGQANSIEAFTFSSGGGADIITFFDTAGNDRFSGRIAQSRFFGAGFDHLAIGVATITANAISTGTDTAFLFDTAGNDTFNASAATATIIGTGKVVNGFETVVGYATGGFDTANLTGTASREVFLGRSTLSTVAGGTLTLAASGYERVNVESGGGNDVARLFGTANVDTLTSGPTTTTLQGTGYQLDANNFQTVVGNALGGGDIANLFDSAGDDSFIANGTSGGIVGPTSNYTAVGFATVNLFGFAGGVNRRTTLVPPTFTLNVIGIWV